jgi:phosphoglycerol transferase MdoB-like AlkP superfamily enzyme
MFNYKQLLRLLFRRLLILFVVYQFSRLLFLLFNRGNFTNLDVTTFLGGALFDLSAIGFINLLFILLHLIPGNFKYHKKYQFGLKVGFYVVNLVFIATNFVDLEYYKFTGRRSSFGLITAKGMEHEIGGLIISFLQEFWYILVGFLLLAILLWRALSKPRIIFPLERLTRALVLKQTGIMLLSLGVGLLMARGGWGEKPLRIVDAINYSSLGNSALVLNTPFSIMKTAGKKEALIDPKFYSTAELNAIFNPVYTSAPEGAPIKKNVVIFILESFGDENLHRGFTPFIDSLATQSYYFKNGFANGKVSIDAVPSTLSSIPSLMNTSIISSGYSLNKVYGLPKIMKKQGYTTSFFHGAFNGSQNFDQYCKVAGFDQYYGKNEYVGPEAFDGSWGIFDEDFMQFFNKKLTSFKQPFFSTLFTISSHNPYTVPAKYKGKFLKGSRKIQESIGYTDYSLRQFFKSAQKEAWYQNTLFVIVADHTCSEPTADEYRTNVGKFRIPILFFDPSNPSFKGVQEKNFQQIDVLPSILDYLKINDQVVTYGKPFTSSKNYVVYYLDNIYHLIQDDYYLAFDGQKAIGLYNFKTDALLKENLMGKDPKRAAVMTRFIKAYVQSFNERMIADQLTTP